MHWYSHEEVDNPILQNLNPQQLEAVTAPDGPLLIIAGAGTGKTRVITRRIAHLVQRQSVRSYQIFAVTFTNKAAGEMKRRIMDLLGETSPAEFNIGTFHSLCARILRREASAANLSRDFSICDEHDQISAIKHVMKRLDITDKMLKPADAQYVINQCKMRMLEPEQVGQVTTSALEDKYIEIFREYQKYMREQHALDFEDLLLCTVRLFENNTATLEHYQQRYRHVLVDEYQDTNPVQFQLVKLLSQQHRNLTVVGDEDQSIYSWRGADISNLLDFQKYFPDARLIRLEQNYRSTASILEAADALIAHNTERIGKTLFTTGDRGQPVYYVVGGREQDEAYAVARTIEQLVQECGYDYRDFAIFYRISALSRVFEDALRLASIPYRVIGGIRFYERAEIKDLTSYLQVIANPGNAVALLRIINTPKRALGPKAVQTIIDYARRNSVSEFEAIKRVTDEALITRAAANQAKTFVQSIHRWREYMQHNSPADLLKQILEDTKYVESLGDPQAMDVRSRTENIQELLNSMVQFQMQYPVATLQDYLENVSLVSAVDELPDQESAVSLMTLHSAKGLEFRAVFIVGLEEGIFPNQRAVMEEGRLQEERRLFYVGMTRAREVLVLTRSDSRMLYGGIRFNMPSAFLQELPADAVQPLAGAQFIRSETHPKPPPRPKREQIPMAAPRLGNTIYQLGQRVRHPLLGEGIITGVSGSGGSLSLILQIDGKMHKLLARYANLELV